MCVIDIIVSVKQNDSGRMIAFGAIKFLSYNLSKQRVREMQQSLIEKDCGKNRKHYVRPSFVSRSLRSKDWNCSLIPR